MNNFDIELKTAQLEKIKAETRKINAEIEVLIKKNDEIVVEYIRDNLDRFVDILPYEIADNIYRRVWSEHVKEDFEARIEERFNNYFDITDEDINKMVNLYVYDGQYDCEQSYWDNLDNLINQILREKTAGI